MRHRRGTGRLVLMVLFAGACGLPLSSPAATTNPAAPPAPATPATPATGPTTRPAGAGQPALPADASTPKDALKLFAAAMRDGDAERLRGVVLTTDPGCSPCRPSTSVSRQRARASDDSSTSRSAR